MRSDDGWRGMLPTSPASAGWLAALFVVVVVAVAIIASVVGWMTLLLVAAAFLGGIALGGSGVLDSLLGDAPAGRGKPSRSSTGTAPVHAESTSDPAVAWSGGDPTAPPPAADPTPAADSTSTADPFPAVPMAPGARSTAAPSARLTAVPAGEGVQRLLELLADQLAVARLVVWRRSGEDGPLEPRLSSDALPPPLAPAGQPLVWSLEQDQPLRIDEGQPWAAGPLAALPFAVAGERLLLTAEAEWTGGRPGPDDPRAGRPPGEAELRQTAAVLQVVLELAGREAVATAAHGRFERVLDFLRDVPRAPSGAGFADGLAEAAVEVAGGVGAVVASWEAESGQVLATCGSGGGPAPGTWFGVMEGDLAMAARAGTTIHRDRREGRPLPLAETGERWTSRPRYTGIVPLRDAAGSTSGVVAVWGEQPLARDGLEILEALGPLLALELHHSTDLAHFRQQATEDALTGLGNRGGLEERIDLERKRFHRYRRPVAVLVLDLDHFKRVNDTWGHPAGDAVLVHVSDILKKATRDTDYPARYGGEELVVLMEETMRREAAEVAERIRATIASASFEWNGTRIPVTASIGVSACPECVDDPGALLRSADAALYASKEGGRNRVTVAPIRGSGT